MKLTFQVSPAPKTANPKRGRHWAVIKRERDRVGKEIWAQVVSIRNAVPGWTLFNRPLLSRVAVHLHREGYTKLDPTGMWESAKPVLDALVVEGIIEDDREPFVTPGTVTQTVVRNRPGWSQLEVTLEER